MARPTILIIGTLDTKGPELSYLHDRILQSGPWGIATLDVGTSPIRESTTLPSGTIFRPQLPQDMDSLSRGDAIAKVIEAAIPVAQALIQDSKIHGIISAGGSCNTSIATTIMRKAAPIGLPKLMVSTMASGDIKHFVEETDITIMPSVVDIAGMNSVLEQILDNAAGSIVGMTSAYFLRLQQAKVNQDQAQQSSRPPKLRIAITMFGVTTPAVNRLRNLLSSSTTNHELYIFHATGSGGKAMERLVSESHLDAIIDLTTTEIADELFGGNLSAGPDRLRAAAEKGIPQIISVGATDMVNFGPKDTVPAEHRSRNLVEHNPAVTLMRTNKTEARKIGEFIAGKLREHVKDGEKVKVLLPMGGVSQLDVEGGAFWDPEADEELFGAVERGLEGMKGIGVERAEGNINDERFVKRVVEVFEGLIGSKN